ncbi:hypothetical protein V8F33_008282 [Rhypophila sp. PSN 637]
MPCTLVHVQVMTVRISRLGTHAYTAPQIATSRSGIVSLWEGVYRGLSAADHIAGEGQMKTRPAEMGKVHTRIMINRPACKEDEEEERLISRVTYLQISWARNRDCGCKTNASRGWPIADDGHVNDAGGSQQTCKDHDTLDVVIAADVMSTFQCFHNATRKGNPPTSDASHVACDDAQSVIGSPVSSPSSAEISQLPPGLMVEHVRFSPPAHQCRDPATTHDEEAMFVAMVDG